MNTSVQGLLEPPKLPVQLEEIKQVLDARYEKELQYINPIEGNHTKSTQFVDLDGDGVEEVLIFHKLASASEHFGLRFYRKENMAGKLTKVLEVLVLILVE